MKTRFEKERLRTPFILSLKEAIRSFLMQKENTKISITAFNWTKKSCFNERASTLETL